MIAVAGGLRWLVGGSCAAAVAWTVPVIVQASDAGASEVIQSMALSI